MFSVMMMILLYSAIDTHGTLPHGGLTLSYPLQVLVRPMEPLSYILDNSIISRTNKSMLLVDKMC